MNQTQQGRTGTGCPSICVVVGVGTHCVTQVIVSVGKSVIVTESLVVGHGKTTGGT